MLLVHQLNNQVLISNEGEVKLDNVKLIEDKFNNKIVLSRNAKIKIIKNERKNLFLIFLLDQDY